MFGFSIVTADQRSEPLVAESFAPLGFDELAELTGALTEPLAFALNVAGPDGKPVPAGTLQMDGPNAAGLIGLVSGGWLPPGLWHREAVLVPDQHTISIIRQHRHGRAADAEADFIDRLAEQPVRCHPLLFMTEGQRGALPKTVAELATRYQHFKTRLAEVLPKAEVAVTQQQAMQSAIGLLDQRRTQMEGEKRFLLAAAPLLIAETGKSRRVTLWQQLLTLAQQHGIAPASQLFIATLSATAALPELNPARDVLKPAKHYTEREAYAALGKLRTLDAMNAAIVQYQPQQVVLLTQDRALAQWCAGVRAYDHSRNGKILNYRLKLERRLFARLDAEEWDALTALIFQKPRAAAATG